MTSLIRRLPFARLLLPRSAARTDAARQAPAPVPPAAVRTPCPDLEDARGAAMRRLFPKLYSWCASRWEGSNVLEVHAYLAAATSVDDLERRIRTVEQRRNLMN